MLEHHRRIHGSQLTLTGTPELSERGVGDGSDSDESSIISIAPAFSGQTQGFTAEPSAQTDSSTDAICKSLRNKRATLQKEKQIAIGAFDQKIDAISKAIDILDTEQE